MRSLKHTSIAWFIICQEFKKKFMAYCCSLTVCKVGLQQKRQFVEEFPPLVLQCQFKGGRKTLPYNMLCCTYWVKSSDFGVELFICFEKYI